MIHILAFEYSRSWQFGQVVSRLLIELLRVPYDVGLAHLLHPVHRLAVEFLLDGDVRHRGRRRRSVPVLLPRRTPDHIAGVDLLDRTAPLLHPATAHRYDQGLAERMRMPGGPGTRLE